MADSLKISNIIVDPDNGSIELQYEFNDWGLQSKVFNSQLDLVNYASTVVQPENALGLFLGLWQAGDSELTDTSLVIGKTLTIDFAAEPIISVA